MCISLIVMGLFEPWRHLRPRATHAVTEGNQPVKKADPPRCEGTGLLKGKPLSMNRREYWQDDSRNG